MAKNTQAEEKPYPSIRIFKNPVLERFTHVHPITPLIQWTPVIAYLLWRTFSLHHLPVTTVALMAGLGLFVWTLTEYFLHRYLFHFGAESPMGKRFVFLIHGLHHDDPIDPTRLVMPPVPGIIFGILLYSFFRLFFGAVWVEPFFAFFVVGYLCYDYTHFAVHHFTPRTRFGKWVKQHHMFHHYVTPDLCWGVSTPFWDIILGTTHEASKSEKKRQTV